MSGVNLTFNFNFPQQPAEHSAIILKGLASIMATLNDLVPQFEALTAQVAKIGTETEALKVKITDLETAITNAGNVPQDVLDKFEALKAQVQAVDDLVADAAPTP
jgi:ABC-type transporter Mla subunit MlaD